MTKVQGWILIGIVALVVVVAAVVLMTNATNKQRDSQLGKLPGQLNPDNNLNPNTGCPEGMYLIGDACYSSP
jgi:hypothetical protein